MWGEKGKFLWLSVQKFGLSLVVMCLTDNRIIQLERDFRDISSSSWQDQLWGQSRLPRAFPVGYGNPLRTGNVCSALWALLLHPHGGEKSMLHLSNWVFFLICLAGLYGPHPNVESLKRRSGRLQDLNNEKWFCSELSMLLKSTVKHVWNWISRCFCSHSNNFHC